MDFSQIANYILFRSSVIVDNTFGDSWTAYRIQITREEDKLFALLKECNGLVYLSLKCNPLLSEILRGKYESVFPGHNLPKKYWNTIILSGQLNWQEIKDLIDHSYNFVSKELK
ncbi:MAG: MmcQ/YjbR family DNA-binding protein [Candidatus Saccharibacteria bacterium]|nr:MmcQ/YjbR family DNA-binding protein [Candidatus Saccharibacteria bacterium]